MRVIFRADAGVEQGTGHVMRCLTLAEELMVRGHQAILVTGGLATAWLKQAVVVSGVEVHSCELDAIPEAQIAALQPDWVVVDSYRIPMGAISALNARVPVLAIVDGDDRGIQASLYLDQNLGAEKLSRSHSDRFLSGATFALVRRAVLAERRADPATLNHPPRLLSFMGGTDPTGASLGIARALACRPEHFALTILAPVAQHAELHATLADLQGVSVLAPTPHLPELLGDADVVISAAGTSAWDVCALGIPSLLIAVVENQRASLREAVQRELALGIDAANDRHELELKSGHLAAKLLGDPVLRTALSRACLDAFDGGGARRVVDAMVSGAGVYAAWGGS
jgi:spore coat polysaccharide biosynthesis predicted glycosyltransferase SpsG